jgi:hypothetical protein
MREINYALSTESQPSLDSFKTTTIKFSLGFEVTTVVGLWKISSLAFTRHFGHGKDAVGLPSRIT